MVGLILAQGDAARAAKDGGEIIERPVTQTETPPRTSRFGLLGSLEFRAPQPKFTEKWSRVIARVAKERALYEFCAWPSQHCPARLTRWRQHLEDMRDLPRLEQLHRLNHAVNALVPYADDIDAFGKKDHWASPLEFIQNRGDCEDYAILKFFSLLELGFDNEQLRLTVVRDRRRQLMHAVLIVQLDGGAYVLDSLHTRPVEHQHMLRYEPVYSVNLDTQWAHIVTSQIRQKFLSELERRGPDGESERTSEWLPAPLIAPDKAKRAITGLLDLDLADSRTPASILAHHSDAHVP